MSRLTGSDVKSMMEAYNAVYAPQEEIELTEEQVWVEVENWVNSLLEEGYDLSDYTWEEMYEAYVEEDSEKMGQYARKEFGKARRVVSDIAGAGYQGYSGQRTTSSNPLARLVNLQTRVMSKPFREVGKFTKGFVTGSSGNDKTPDEKNPPANQKGDEGNKDSGAAGDSGGSNSRSSTVLAKKGGVEGRLDKATGKWTAGSFSDADKSRYASVAAKNAAAKPAPASKLSSGGRKGNADLEGKTFATGTTADGTKFERRTPTSAEMAASKAAGGGEAGVKAAVERSSKLMGGPEGAGKIDTASVQRDLAKANAPKPSATPTPAAAPKPPTRQLSAADKRQGIKASYEYDAYDLVLEYLLSQGHADTLEEANYVMLEMDAEMVQDIVEAAKDQSDKQIEKGVKTTYKAGNVLDNTHQGRSPGLNKLPAGERKGKTERMRGRLKSRRDDLFGERNKREDEKMSELKKKLGL
jgi:hypothetical protein